MRNSTKNTKYPSKYVGNIYTTFGSTDVISVRYLLPLGFVFVNIGRSSSRYEKYFRGSCTEERLGKQCTMPTVVTRSPS